MIPPFEDGTWYLPQGLHAATLEEIDERFVAAAPFTDRRRIVFDAFQLWHGVVSGIVPGARFWVDGGFITHKSWAAPSDVDVTVMLRPDDLNNLPDDEQQRLDVPGQHFGASRLIGGWPLRAEWRRSVL